MVATALTVVLLSAVPVSALTFSPWVITQSAKKGAPTPVIVPDHMGPGSLFVDMGRATTRGAKTTVTATRTVTVGPGSEDINFMHTFETFLRDASLSVSFKLQGIKSKTKFTGGPAGQTFPFSVDRNRVLTPGDYTAKIKIKYKNKNGEWDNTAPPPGSPHEFKITSI